MIFFASPVVGIVVYYLRYWVSLFIFRKEIEYKLQSHIDDVVMEREGEDIKEESYIGRRIELKAILEEDFYDDPF